MTEYEIHAKEFLQYVAENEKRLKKNLKKNITYDSEIFDDVFNDSIIKVYDYIINKKQFIEDFEQFFFIVSKFRYIQLDNSKKKRTSEKVDIDPSKLDIYEEEYIDKGKEVNELINWLSDYLEQYFSPSDVDMFIIYYRLKCGKNKVSYFKLSKIINRSYGYIAKRIKEMKRFVQNDKEIQDKKRKLLIE